jgi:hypothetical protein
MRGAGRHWIRLTPQHPDDDGAACVGTSGLPSLTFTWDGRDLKGQPVGAGIYLLSLDERTPGGGVGEGQEVLARRVLVLR